MAQNSLELDFHKYGQLIFDKGNSVEKRLSIQQMMLEQLNICLQKKLTSYITSHTKINLK